MKIWDKHFVALQIFVATNIQLHVFSQGDLVAAISWWMGMSMYVTSWCDVVLSYTEAFKARFPACRHACMFLPRTLTLTDMILMIRWALNLQWLRTGPRHTAMRSATGAVSPSETCVIWFDGLSVVVVVCCCLTESTHPFGNCNLTCLPHADMTCDLAWHVKCVCHLTVVLPLWLPAMCRAVPIW